jgi:hypothetical protein
MGKYRIASVTELVRAAENDPQLAADLQQNPVKALREVASALETDRWVYRIVVIGLSVALIGALGGGVALAILKLDVPAMLVAIGSGALGALGGLLAPSPSR